MPMNKISKNVLLWLRVSLLMVAVFLLTVPPAPAQSESEETPPAVVPPEGEGDTWGYDVDNSVADVDQVATAPTRPKIERARLVGEPGHRWVQGTRRLVDGAARAEFSRQGDWMAYDKPGERGQRALYINYADGDSEKCLTCEHWEFRNANVLAPTWHPGGEILVALVQGVGKKLDLDLKQLATPARGLHADLWAFTRDGRDSWQMTQVVRQGGAILDPVFSQEGGHLAWTERYDTTVGGRWGAWQVRVAEFDIKRGLPRIDDVRTFRLPSPAVATLHGFTDDDRGLWLSVAREEDGVRTLRTARLELESGRLEWLPPLGQWDDLVAGVPRGTRRVFASDRDLSTRGGLLPRRSDLWFSSASGRRQERLTFYNDAGSPDSLGEAWIADLGWSPRGESLLLHILKPDGAGGVEEAIYALDLSPELAGQQPPG